MSFCLMPQIRTTHPFLNLATINEQGHNLLQRPTHQVSEKDERLINLFHDHDLKSCQLASL